MAYSILVEEYQRMGHSLIDAMEKAEPVVTAATEARPVPKAVAASNEASMTLLQGMLGGVQNSPTKRKPRRAKK